MVYANAMGQQRFCSLPAKPQVCGGMTSKRALHPSANFPFGLATTGSDEHRFGTKWKIATPKK